MKLIATILFLIPLLSFGQTRSELINENFKKYPGSELNESNVTWEQTDSLNKLKVGWDWRPSKYKAGYTFIDRRGYTCTLLKWIKMPDWSEPVQEYTWRVKVNIRQLFSFTDYMQDSQINEGRKLKK